MGPRGYLRVDPRAGSRVEPHYHGNRTRELHQPMKFSKTKIRYRIRYRIWHCVESRIYISGRNYAVEARIWDRVRIVVRSIVYSSVGDRVHNQVVDGMDSRIDR